MVRAAPPDRTEGHGFLNRSIVYQFLDADARRAAREYALWQISELRRPRNLAWTAAGLVVWWLTFSRPSHWFFRVLMGTLTGLLVLTLALFAFMWWWTPQAAVRKLRHLPHRTIEATFGHKLIVRSATEYVELDWSELKDLVPLPSFLLVRLKSGAELPFPRPPLGADGEAELVAHAASLGAPLRRTPG